jgi:hypothetical protein
MSLATPEKANNSSIFEQMPGVSLKRVASPQANLDHGFQKIEINSNAYAKANMTKVKQPATQSLFSQN